MAIAVVPAAGRSSRMGRPKLLLRYGQDTILGATLAALREGGVRQTILVVQPADRELRSWAEARDLQCAVNPRPDDGMLTSVWAGLEAVGGAEALIAAGEELVVCPGDLPRLRAGTVAALLREARATGASLLVPRCGSERGHPLIVGPDLLAEISTLDPQVGLRALRLRHPERTVEVEVGDPGVVHDVDTPEDYARLNDAPT
jgi:CTP:molybdopterin cytidylyltransferase MocA